jgi:uncharacterized repeat protein (TIGR03803 family)
MPRNRSSFLAIPGLLFLLACSAQAQDYSVLYNFLGAPGNDGAEPSGSLVQSGSLLYGVTGDPSTVFAFNTTTDAETVLHSFPGSLGDGLLPNGGLILSGSYLYGTTYAGGSDDLSGTIFQLDTTNNSEIVLHSFNNPPKTGFHPNGALLQSGSIFYGLTVDGGTLFNGGTLFSLDTSTNTFSVLHSFGVDPSDGRLASGSVIQSGSDLYGMTSVGGNNNDGTIFDYNTATKSERVLYSFGSTPQDGVGAGGTLLQSGPILYGETGEGGANNDGTIFAFNTLTNTERVLYSFTNSPDNGPTSPDGYLAQIGSTLYGMTTFGGSSDTNGGMIFAFDTITGSYSILHSFDGLGGLDGDQPNGGLLVNGETLYGMTAFGGANNDGIIFSISVPEPSSISLLGVAAMALLARRRRK